MIELQSSQYGGGSGDSYSVIAERSSRGRVILVTSLVHEQIPILGGRHKEARRPQRAMSAGDEDEFCLVPEVVIRAARSREKPTPAIVKATSPRLWERRSLAESREDTMEGRVPVGLHVRKGSE